MRQYTEARQQGTDNDAQLSAAAEKFWLFFIGTTMFLAMILKIPLAVSIPNAYLHLPFQGTRDNPAQSNFLRVTIAAFSPQLQGDI